MRLHAVLLLEPWCFTVGQVKALTAWQVERLYLRPAAERAEALRREMDGGRGGTPGPAIDTSDMAAFCEGMEAAFPGEKTREQWEADWGRMQGGASDGR